MLAVWDNELKSKVCALHMRRIIQLVSWCCSCLETWKYQRTSYLSTGAIIQLGLFLHHLMMKISPNRSNFQSKWPWDEHKRANKYFHSSSICFPSMRVSYPALAIFLKAHTKSLTLATRYLHILYHSILPLNDNFAWDSDSKTHQTILKYFRARFTFSTITAVQIQKEPGNINFLYQSD